MLESVYPTLAEAVHNRLVRRLGSLASGIAPLLLWQVPLRLGVSVEAVRPIEAVSRVGCPILDLAGERDRRTPPRESRRLAAVSDSAELVLIPEAGQVDLLSKDLRRWRGTVLPFLSAAIKRRSGSLR